jgi:hypothetical protein
METKAIKNRTIITYSTSGWSHPVDVLSEEIGWGCEDGEKKKKPEKVTNTSNRTEIGAAT